MALPLRRGFHYALTMTRSPTTSPLRASQLRPDLPVELPFDLETRRVLAKERRHSRARRGWVTRRHNMQIAAEKSAKHSTAAKKGWETRRRNQRAAAAKKGWQTRRRNRRSTGRRRIKAKRRRTR